MIDLFYAGYGNSKFAKTIVDCRIIYGSLYKKQSLINIYKSWYPPEVVNIPAADIDDRTLDWLKSFDNQDLDILISEINTEQDLYRAGRLAEWTNVEIPNGIVAAEPGTKEMVWAVNAYLEDDLFHAMAYAPIVDRKRSGEENRTSVLDSFIEASPHSVWLTRGYPHQQMKAATKIGLDYISMVDITPVQVMAGRALIWYHYDIPNAINRWFASISEMGLNWPEDKVGKHYFCLEQSIINIRLAWDEMARNIAVGGSETPPPPPMPTANTTPMY